MGIGLIWLLERIRKFGSINKAAKDMGMSYAKAHRILKRLEKYLGKKILNKTIGGKDHGGAELTPFADKFVEKYDRFQRKVKDFGEMEFSKFIDEFGEKEGKQ